MLRDAPVLPRGCELLWADFCDLHAMRGSTGAGPARIGFHDIEAYRRETGAVLRPWQVKAIRLADDAWFASRAEK